MNKLLVGTLLVLIVLLIGGVGFYIFQNQKIIKKLSQTTVASQTTPSPQTTQAKTNSSPSPSPFDLKSNIQDALNSKNFAALATYTTTPKVNFSLMSSGCCEPQTPQEAAAQMDYIQEGVPMDFNQQNPKILHIKERKPEFANAFIGISKNKEHVAIFTIDANNKISAIQLSLSYTFYDF